MSYPPIPCLTELGSGYDVIRGIYASPKSCTKSLVDWTKDGPLRPQDVHGMDDAIKESTKTYGIPKSVAFHPVYDSTYYGISGSSSENYSKSLSVHAKLEGNYNFFAGSLSVDYNQSDTSSLSNTFNKIHHSVILYNLVLPSVDTLRSLLNDDVARDIEKKKPMDLYYEYGTHIVNSLAVGGRANFTSATDTRKYKSEYGVEVAAQMSYKVVVGSITAEEKTKYAAAMESFNESSSVRVRTQGGNPIYADEKFPQHIVEWKKSLLNFAAMDDFGSLPYLIPIWQLASTEARRTELQKELEKYLAKENIDLSLPPPYLETSLINYPLELAGWLPKDDGDYISFKRPRTEEPRFFPGPVIGDNTPRGQAVLEKVTGALADVRDWSLIRDFEPSGNRTMIWRSVPPTRNYILLSDFICELFSTRDVQQATVKNPPAETVKNLKAVHIACLEEGKYINKRSVGYGLWVWDIAWEDGLVSGFWRIGFGESEPDVPAYVLNKKYIKE